MALNWDTLYNAYAQRAGNGTALQNLYQEGAVGNQLTLEQQIAEKAMGERYGRVKNNPAYGSGYYTYTPKDMQQWMNGISTPALEQAKLIKQEAEMFGIPLEEYDPDSPYLLPWFADNKYDAQRNMETFKKELPKEYRIAHNPDLDPWYVKMNPFGSYNSDWINYMGSKKNAEKAMMKDGLTGKQIEQVLEANEAMHGVERSNASLLERLLGKTDDSGVGGMNYVTGAYNPNWAKQVGSKLSEVNKDVKSSFVADMANSAQAIDHQFGTNLWDKYFNKSNK